jgi:hypothetical protein
MSDPITIGAGLGAGLSVLQGKSPLTGALMGGVGGGMFGGANGFGSGFTQGGGLFSGLKGVAPEAVSLGSGGYAQLAQNPLGAIGGAAKGGINFGANGINSTLGGTNLPLGGQGIQIDKFNPAINFTDDGLAFADKGLSSADQMFANKFVTEQNPFALDPRRLAVNTPLSLGEQFTDMISNPFSNLTERDKLGLGLQGGNMLMNSLEGAPPPRTMQAPSPIPTQYNTSAQLDPSLASMVQRKKYPYMIG